MTDGSILEIFDLERRTLTPPRCKRQAEYNSGSEVVRHLPTIGDQYWVIYSHHTAKAIDAGIEREQGHLQSLQPQYGQFEWKVYDHDQPANLRGRLLTYGFEVGEPEALLVLDIAHAPAGLHPLMSLDVRRVTSAEGVRDYESVSQAVFGRGLGAHRDEIERLVMSNDSSVSVYVAYEGTLPVSASRITFDPGSQFAGLWGGATLESHRGKGYYTATVAARLREAQARGVRFLTIDALPMSRLILERRGFQFLGYTYPCVWRSPGSRKY